jgi:general secretion pathway protein E
LASQLSLSIGRKILHQSEGKGRQRLVRLLCLSCKRERKLTDEVLSIDPRYTALGIEKGATIYEPHGCERCSGTGYRGRTGVFEILQSDE